MSHPVDLKECILQIGEEMAIGGFLQNILRIIIEIAIENTEIITREIQNLLHLLKQMVLNLQDGKTLFTDLTTENLIEIGMTTMVNGIKIVQILICHHPAEDLMNLWIEIHFTRGRPRIMMAENMSHFLKELENQTDMTTVRHQDILTGMMIILYGHIMTRIGQKT